MSYLPFSLSSLTAQINRTIFLPHIQRPFVWDETQMIRLFDSLMRNFPVQTLLLWRTNEEIKVRKFMQSISSDQGLHTLYDQDMSSPGREKTLVLDGQQRMQSLYSIFRGSISDEDGDEKIAFFDVASGVEKEDEDLSFNLVFAETSPGATFYRVRDLVEADVHKTSEDLADRYNDMLVAERGFDRDRERLVRRNFSKLSDLFKTDKFFYAQTLDGIVNPADYPYSNILRIFVRVNSGGTKLSPSDLMYAVMKAEFADVEQNIEETVEMLESSNLPFERDFVLKCLLTALGKGAVVDKKRLQSAEFIRDLKDRWPAADRAFEAFTDFLIHDLRANSSKEVSSFNSFIAIFDYLFHHPKPTPGDKARMKAYFYRAQIFGWFGGSTDSVINRLHAVVSKPEHNTFPLDAISAAFGLPAGHITVPDEIFRSKSLKPLLLSIIYLEKFGSSPFNFNSKDNAPQIDHIYAQSPLRNKLGMNAAQIGQIGNLRFVGANENNRKRAELPGAYFSRLRQEGVDIARHLLVDKYCDDPSLLCFDDQGYQQFCNERFAVMRTVVESAINASA